MKYFCLIVSLLILFMGMSCREMEGEAERLYILAVSAYSEEKLDDALVFAQSALQIDKTLHQADFLIAKVLFFQEKYKQALSILEKLIKRHPEFTDARLWRIRVHLLLQNYSKAESLLDTEISLNQTDWRLYYLYSVLGLHIKDYSMQFTMIKRAELALKDSGRVFIDLAQIMFVSDMTERAENYLNKARSISDSASSLQALYGGFETVFEKENIHE